MPYTRDVFNHHNKDLVEIKWSCKGFPNLSESSILEFVKNGDLSFSCCYHDHFELVTLTYILPVHPSTCLFWFRPTKNCWPADFITTTLNYTVLVPSNYSLLRCGHVEKAHKSTEVWAPGLELWENWKQMISSFFCLHPFFQHLTFLSTSFGIQDNERAAE